MAEFNAPESRNEAILQNMLGANNVLLEPQSRNERLLLKLLGEDVEIEPPQSRIEELLTLLIEQGGVGGDRDWKEIGYDNEPDFIEAGFAYAKQIHDSWNPSNTTRIFDDDTNLVFMPMVDTSAYQTMRNMFRGCTHLLTIPQIDTKNVATMADAFERCASLEYVPQLDTSSVTNMASMFANCLALSDESLNNVLGMCIGATAYTGEKTLSNLGLTNTQKTKCQSLSNWDSFVAAGWSA